MPVKVEATIACGSYIPAILPRLLSSAEMHRIRSYLTRINSMHIWLGKILLYISDIDIAPHRVHIES